MGTRTKYTFKLDIHLSGTVAIAFSIQDVLAILWRNTTEHQLSANGETILHYAARYKNERVTKFACESKNGIDVTQTSTHEQRTTQKGSPLWNGKSSPFHFGQGNTLQKWPTKREQNSSGGWKNRQKTQKFMIINFNTSLPIVLYVM